MKEIWKKIMIGFTLCFALALSIGLADVSFKLSNGDSELAFSLMLFIPSSLFVIFYVLYEVYTRIYKWFNS